MKNLLTNLTLILIIVSQLTYSQEKDNLLNSYTDYFQNTRELPFLHLNKTTFLNGEEIWFSAYVIEQNSNKLHNTTSNLYVSIFDSSGELKDQQLINIKQGRGQGSIYLDSTYTNNHYYIKASTNWMKNFNDDNAYYQKVSVLNSNSKPLSITVDKEKYYDFQLFPEGGHLLSQTFNNIAFLIKNPDNKGVKIRKGIIKDANNNIIKEFSTNAKGMGSVSLLIKDSNPLIFEATLYDGSIIKKETPKINSNGLILRVIPNNPESLFINILTNRLSLANLNNKTYKVLIHNTRSFNQHSFTFNDKDVTYAIVLDKKNIPDGMNIITVFNENNKPISERLFFKNPENFLSSTSLEHTTINNDSTSIIFNNNTKENITISSSFLPNNTIAYNPNQSIISTTLLNPYVNGVIENPEYYFNDITSEKQEELDLLLITQGWSKYNWNNIFTNPPSTNFSFENGITINGSFGKKIKAKQSILIYSKENSIVRLLSSLESNFSFENWLLRKGSTIDFALKTNEDLYKIVPSLSYSNSSLNETIDINHFKTYKNYLLEPSQFKNLPKDIEELDEVILVGKTNKTKNANNKVYGAVTMLTAVKMKDRINASGETVVDFLKMKNYPIEYNGGELILYSRGFSKYGQTAFSDSYGSGKYDVRVFLDDVEISDDLWMLEAIYLNTVKEIYYGRNSDNRSDEHVYIYTLSPSEYSSRKAEYHSVKVPVGFSIEKEYYSPKYPSFTDETYINYGAVYWNPNLTIAPNSSIELKIPNNSQDKINLYLEGISDSGKLLSTQKTIQIK